MKTILSQYIHFFRTKENILLIYNSENNAFFKVSEEIYDYIEALSKEKDTSISPNIKDLLIKHKIIIPDSKKYSYYNKIKLISYMERFSQNKLTLNVMPTTSCNFYCPYCFEKTKTNHTISDEIIDNLIQFINKHTNTKILNLMWYGGEPLLAFNKIEKILLRLEKEVSIPLKAHSIVTNGYLFDQNVCELFKKYPLTDIQITLDGSENEHNQKRFSKTDKSTYSKILNNIDLILNELPETHVFIRVNIDEKNKASFQQIYELLHQRWKGKNISLYPGFVRIENEEQTQMIAPSIIENSQRNFFMELEENGVGVNFYPTIRDKTCSAVRINSYIIGPEGEIYKCWNDVSNKNKIIGYINSSRLTNADLLAKYMVDSSIFDDAKCKDCFFFPICAGGCPQYRLQNKYENGSYNLCAVRNDKKVNKQYLTSCLEKHYQKIEGAREVTEIY